MTAQAARALCGLLISFPLLAADSVAREFPKPLEDLPTALVTGDIGDTWGNQIFNRIRRQFGDDRMFVHSKPQDAYVDLVLNIDASSSTVTVSSPQNVAQELDLFFGRDHAFHFDEFFSLEMQKNFRSMLSGPAFRSRALRMQTFEADRHSLFVISDDLLRHAFGKLGGDVDELSRTGDIWRMRPTRSVGESLDYLWQHFNDLQRDERAAKHPKKDPIWMESLAFEIAVLAAQHRRKDILNALSAQFPGPARWVNVSGFHCLGFWFDASKCTDTVATAVQGAPDTGENFDTLLLLNIHATHCRSEETRPELNTLCSEIAEFFEKTIMTKYEVERSVYSVTSCPSCYEKTMNRIVSLSSDLRFSFARQVCGHLRKWGEDRGVHGMNYSCWAP